MKNLPNCPTAEQDFIGRLSMRELTKSLLHCSWALSFFGAHQLRNAVIQRSALQLQEFAEALDNIAEAACRDLSPWELTAYSIGITVQDGLVDVIFQGAGSLHKAMPEGLPHAAWSEDPGEAAPLPRTAQRSEMPAAPARTLHPTPANDKPRYIAAGA
jgi:hypothetical protein